MFGTDLMSQLLSGLLLIPPEKRTSAQVKYVSSGWVHRGVIRAITGYNTFPLPIPTMPFIKMLPRKRMTHYYEAPAEECDEKHSRYFESEREKSRL